MILFVFSGCSTGKNNHMKRFFIILIYCILISGKIFGQTDSLMNAVRKMPDDSLKINALIKLSEQLKNTDKSNAVKYSDAAAKLANKLHLPQKEALVYKNSGNIHYTSGDYKAAYEYYQISLDLYVRLNDEKGIAVLYRNIGSVFHQQGNYEEALSYFNKSLVLREKLKDNAGIAALYNAMGLLYMEQGEGVYEKASGYFEKSLKIYQTLKQANGIASAYYSLGTLSSYMKRNENATQYYLKYLHLADSLNDNKLRARAHYALVAVYLKTEQFDKCEFHANEAIRLCAEQNNNFDLAGAYFNAGDLYYTKRELEKAKNFYLKSYELSKQLNAVVHQKNAADQLRKIYKEQGDFKNALIYSESFIVLKDSLESANLTESISKYEMQLDFNEMIKEKELNVQKRDLEHIARLNQQKIYTISSIVALLLALGLVIFVLKLLKTKKTANKLLTAQNPQILLQNEELNQKNEEIQQQSEEIGKQHKEIIDSINYAKRIQQAILPTEQFLSEILSEYFVLFKPRDIVSGDFYWAKQIKNYTIYVVADCTGHGVPGAFMSMLGTSFLNEIITSRSLDSSGEILDKLRHKVKKSLNQTGVDGEQKDGMDISLMIIDNEKMQLSFAGAYNSLYIIRNGEEITLKADRQPIGIFIKEHPFETQSIDLQTGDCLYALSDGYPDQFGGEDGDKFKIARFKKLITSIHSKPMNEQKAILENTFADWTHGYDQVDDVLVFGIRI